uniref:Uncharacterized protein n=1 Tax=Aegilops tauschii subsp. strangulata TaxID=200361 RepID=A0A453BEI9_AEGTS
MAANFIPGCVCSEAKFYLLDLVIGASRVFASLST